jgi:uronate dehydrogenase
MKKRLLVTGAAGEIGQTILPYLNQNYTLRAYDRRSAFGYSETFTGDICDFLTLTTAMKDVDAVLHLTYPTDDEFDSWETVLTTGLDGTHNVFEAAIKNGIRKILYASTIKINHRDRGDTRLFTSQIQPTPVDLYAGGKLMAENLALTYTTLNPGLDIVCLRIAGFRRLPLITDRRSEIAHLGWCHPEDLAQLVDKCITTPGLGFQVFYAVSRAGAHTFDIHMAEVRVGYHPQHNAHDYFVSDHLEDLPFTRNQRTLMRATLLEDKTARQILWKRWSATLNLKLDIPKHQAIYDLLPMAYKVVDSEGANAPAEERLLLERMAGVLKRTWYQAQLHLAMAGKLALYLQDHNIRPIYLDDLAAYKLLYPAEQVRKVHDITLMVNPTEQAQTVALLGDFGWQASPNNPSPAVQQFEQNSLRLTLRKNLAPWFELPWSKVQAHISQVDGLTLPDYHLFFLLSCWQAVHGWQSPALLGVADSARLLHLESPRLSAQVLLDLARAANVRVGLFYGLHMLKRLLELPAAARLNSQLLNLSLGRRERLLAWLIASKLAHRTPHRLRHALLLNGVGLR